jgi:hypothetical protein
VAKGPPRPSGNLQGRTAHPAMFLTLAADAPSEEFSRSSARPCTESLGLGPRVRIRAHKGASEVPHAARRPWLSSVEVVIRSVIIGLYFERSRQFRVVGCQGPSLARG